MTHPPLLCFRVRNCRFRLVLVEGGVFRMGSDKTTDPDAYGDEAPPHDVRVASFYLGEYPVTQELWQAVMGEDNAPFYFTGARRPAEQVSWNDAQAFIEKLSRETSQPIRLPTEAEWEYAARGGGYNRGYQYAGSDRLKEACWFGKNSHDETKPAGRRAPNELGLYDLSGNVWEWCEDQWHSDYKNAPDDGSAWVDRGQGSPRVYRGGSWDFSPQYCRVAYRGYWSPGLGFNFLGFRLAVSLQ